MLGQTSPIPRAPQTAGSHPDALSPIIGESQPIHDLKRRLARISPTDVNVLITGETGTGKEMVAAAIHACSKRKDRHFVAVNCAALPDSLIESELFGHVRGAFTGAFQSRAGKLRHSDGGSVFLDEIGELSLAAQAKLLRAIESREIQALGGDESATADFRLITATNQALEERVESGTFRRDLYYRLDVAHVHLPALRERVGDIELLIRHYLAEFSCQFTLAVDSIAEDALDALRTYAWPGNVRELRNVLESAFLSVEGNALTLSDLPDRFRGSVVRESAPPALSERDRLIGVLREVNWNKSKAADKLQWSRMTLYRKLARYDLQSESARPRHMKHAV